MFTSAARLVHPRTLVWCSTILAALIAVPASTSDESELVRVDKIAFDAPYSRDGADSCLKCHDEDSEFPVMAIFRTPHAVPGDARTPFGGAAQCESCHGPGGEHAGRVRRGEPRPAILGFGPQSSGTVEQRNGVCLTCHDNQLHGEWQGSEHDTQQLACTSCHTVHARHDPVTSRDTQPEICMSCHVEQRADSLKFSSHPVRFDAMACSDCHTPHSSLKSSALVEATTNELCFTCHAEKRGPYLWEHAPATEDCSTCHTPHGSNHPDLLVKRAPLLCQSCHSSAGHPSLALDGERLPGGRPSALLLGNSCTNCHSQVHGSNHPSGASLNR